MIPRQARGRHKDLLEGLRAEGDDSRQFQNLIELGEFLAMANEVRSPSSDSTPCRRLSQLTILI